LAVCNAAADSAVSVESAGSIEYGSAAGFDELDVAFPAGESHLEAVIGLARVEQPAVIFPCAFDRKRVQVPAGFTDRSLGIGFRRRTRIPSHDPGKPLLGILLPVPVARQLGDGAEALLALAQGLIAFPLRSGSSRFFHDRALHDGIPCGPVEAAQPWRRYSRRRQSGALLIDLAVT